MTPLELHNRRLYDMGWRTPKEFLVESEERDRIHRRNHPSLSDIINRAKAEQQRREWEKTHIRYKPNVRLIRCGVIDSEMIGVQPLWEPVPLVNILKLYHAHEKIV